MIKNVCHYTAQMEYVGGIESVIRQLYPIFAAHGVQCWTACELGNAKGLPNDSVETFKSGDRCEQWDRFLEKHPTDVVILHYVVSETLSQEIVHLKGKGVKCIRAMHSSFPSAMLLNGEERFLEKAYFDAKLCENVVTVSELDARWWRALGLKAVHVQNPFVHPSKSVETIRRRGEDGAANLLWVGRLCEPKQPKAALAAFARAARACPGISLTMVGGSAQGNKKMSRLAKKLHVQDKVTFINARQDIEDLWAKADVHLLTSITESFCLVIAEAKAHGIPTLMFDVPFLELTQSGAGVVKVPQGDIDRMAQAIVNLTKDESLRSKLGLEARNSLVEFNETAVWKSWENAFDIVEGSAALPETPDAEKLLVEQVYFAWHRYCDKNLWAVRMAEHWQLLTRASMRPLAYILEGVVGMIRRLKGFGRRIK